MNVSRNWIDLFKSLQFSSYVVNKPLPRAAGFTAGLQRGRVLFLQTGLIQDD